MDVDLAEALTEEKPTRVFVRMGPTGLSPFTLVIDGVEQTGILALAVFGGGGSTVDLVLQRYDADAVALGPYWIEHYVGVVFDSISPE